VTKLRNLACGKFEVTEKFAAVEFGESFSEQDQRRCETLQIPEMNISVEEHKFGKCLYL